MDSKIISTKSGRESAFTLVELMVATALGLIALMAVGMMSWYSSRSFAAIANYVSLDQASQLALDKMSKEIRQARRLASSSATSLDLVDIDGVPLQYVYDPDAKTLVRMSHRETNILLTGCESLQFTNYQRTPVSNSFDVYPSTSLTNSKVIQVTWTCSRKILGAKVNTESIQSAKIALRNN
jgi:prepilin-type N-terminal cleavage/methylation domain-containing protein